MKISKELLNAVLNIYVCIEDMNPYIQDNMVIYDILDYKSINTKHINIYELALKCKEWAYKQGFIIDTGFHKYYINQFKANCYGWVSSNINIKQHFNECTEYEAIFKACQWILDNQEG